MNHPDEQQLRDFTVGRLSDGGESKIEEHLACCAWCRKRLDEIERKKSQFDSMLHEMRLAGEKVRNEDFAEGQILNHQFQLKQQIGRGGMGVAWKAEDLVGKRPVVIKFVSEDVAHFSEALATFQESFYKVHALQHQHICPLYELHFDQQAGLFLTMKFIDGQPLDIYRKSIQNFSLNDLITILRPVAEALDYAHQMNVIHRDVKPQNILIGKTDGVQLIDFGLADAFSASKGPQTALPQKITGTRSYMSPEQWQGRLDFQTDQYALAVTAYELLSGSVPFGGIPTDMLRDVVCHQKPEPIPGLNPAVQAALMRGLEKNPKDRFATCGEFVDALAGTIAVPYDRKSEEDRQRHFKRIFYTITGILTGLVLMLIFLFFLSESRKKTISETIPEPPSLSSESASELLPEISEPKNAPPEEVPVEDTKPETAEPETAEPEEILSENPEPNKAVADSDIFLSVPPVREFDLLTNNISRVPEAAELLQMAKEAENDPIPPLNVSELTLPFSREYDIYGDDYIPKRIEFQLIRDISYLMFEFGNTWYAPGPEIEFGSLNGRSRAFPVIRMAVLLQQEGVIRLYFQWTDYTDYVPDLEKTIPVETTFAADGVFFKKNEGKQQGTTVRLLYPSGNLTFCEGGEANAKKEGWLMSLSGAEYDPKEHYTAFSPANDQKEASSWNFEREQNLPAIIFFEIKDQPSDALPELTIDLSSGNETRTLKIDGNIRSEEKILLNAEWIENKNVTQTLFDQLPISRRYKELAWEFPFDSDFADKIDKVHYTLRAEQMPFMLTYMDLYGDFIKEPLPQNDDSASPAQ